MALVSFPLGCPMPKRSPVKPSNHKESAPSEGTGASEHRILWDYSGRSLQVGDVTGPQAGGEDGQSDRQDF